ncbi:MAG: hypothetical protein DGJ47_000268 [Rickettsiaceae bacterium]
MSKLIISLDGPSASGKGLIGSMLATEFSLQYFQSSLVYRGLAYVCLCKSINSDDIRTIIQLAKDTDIFRAIQGVDLQTEEISDYSSKISVISEVRDILGVYLKKIIASNDRVIMEGRDIGTVIAPEAHLKLFITADLQVRAQRRYKQLCLSGKYCTLSDVLDMMKKRDERDSSRISAPLKAAEEAFALDTSKLSPEEIVDKIKNYVVNHFNANDLQKMFNLKR